MELNKRRPRRKTALQILLMLLAAITIALTILITRYPFFAQELGLYTAIFSPPDIAKPDPAITTIEDLDRLITDQLESKSIRAASVAIVTNGEAAWSNGYGTATADTPFMIGSVSKAVMGITIMHAVENGLVDLDSDINEYLPFAVHNPLLENSAPITLRHLATHTSGIQDNDRVYTGSYVVGDSPIELGDFLRDYLVDGGKQFQAKSNFIPSQPGETYEYSNIAAGLAAYVIESAAGIPFDQYSRENIFEPLNLTNTGWHLRDFADPTQIAQPHAFNNRPHPHYGYATYPDGQLRASANDLARLLALIANGGELDGIRLLQPQTIEQMLAKQTFPGLATESGEAIFWSYTKSGLIGHNGGDFGATAMLYLNRETNIGTVVLANASPSRAISPVATITRQITTGPHHIQSEIGTTGIQFSL